MEIMKRLFKEEEGQGMVEYALIIALVGVALIASMKLLKGDISGIFEGIKTAIDAK